MRSKHKAQVIKANPAESTQFTRLKDIFFRGTLPYSDGRAGLAGLLEERRSLAEPSEPLAGGTIQGSSCFFFLLSPRCLEKHKDFDIWAEQRGGNTTMAHADSLFGVFFFSPRRRENYTFTFSRFLLPRHNTQIKSIKKAKPQHQPNPYSKLIYVSE